MPNNHSFPMQEVDNRPIYDLVWGSHTGPVVELALELGIFEYLAQTADSIEGVAAQFDLSLYGAEAVLAVSAAAGFLAVGEAANHYCLSEMGRTFLLQDSPYYFDGYYPRNWPFMEQLREAVKSEQEPPDPLAVSMKDASVEDVRGFIDRMHMITLSVASGLARQPVFGRLQKLLDVAGGSGSLSCAIAAQNPNIQCTVLDLPPVCAIAQENIEKFGLGDQVDTTTADMFKDPLPAGYDAILFGNIFHNWDADTCRLLAQNSCDALPAGGTILLHEMLLNEKKDGPLTVACFSVSMLLHEKGKQYTFNELNGFLEGAGFRDVSAVPSAGYYSLVSARK